MKQTRAELALIQVPEDVARVAALALDTRAKRGGGGTARGVVIATALATGYVRPTERAEIRAWHAAHPEDCDGVASTLIGGMYGGAPARSWPMTAAAMNPAGEGAMIAIGIPLEIAERVARPDGELPSEMHMTLFYLAGDVGELDDETRESYLRCIEEGLRGSAVDEVRLTHVERFVGDDGMEPAALVDGAPGLYELRERIRGFLDAAGLGYSDSHAFRAHATIGYYAPGDGPESGPVEDSLDAPPFSFVPGGVDLHWGANTTRVPFETPGPFVAALTPTDRQLQELARRTNRADRALVAKLHGAANIALKDALRHAGVKLKVRAKNKSRPIAAALDEGIPATPAMMAAVGVTEQELLDGRFETYGVEAKALFAQAERRKLRAAAAAVGLDPDEMEAVYADEIDDRSERAAGFLVISLGVLARAALSGSSFPTTGPGEYAGPVPFGVIRTAWSVAATGAHAPSVPELGPGPADVDAIAQSLARAGQTLVEEILTDELGPLVLTSTWSHGDPDRPLAGHENLDGVSWESGGAYPPELYVSEEDAWLGREMYEPGDHDGCTCWIDTEFAPAESTTTGTTESTVVPSDEMEPA